MSPDANSPHSYLLAICTFTPLYGRLCNVMGRRGANQTAVILAGIGTLACGLSNSMEMLIVARFVRRTVILSASCPNNVISVRRPWWWRHIYNCYVSWVLNGRAQSNETNGCYISES